MIAEKWRFNEIMTDVLGCHHDLARAAEENRELVSIVSVANLNANNSDIRTAGNPSQDKDGVARGLELLGLHSDDLESLTETVVGEIFKARIFLSVAKRGGHEDKILGGAGLHTLPGAAYREVRRQYALHRAAPAGYGAADHH
jgi:hypothetical protein